MIVRQADLFKGWTKVDNHVTTNKKISDGAFRLYAYYSGLRHGDNFVDKYVIKGLGISKQVLTKRRKELKDADLICVDQIAARIYVIYIGNTRMSASRFKIQFEKEERDRAAIEQKD